MTTLTITTTNGTAHTYSGLTLDEAQQRRDSLKHARSQQHQWWSTTNGTTTDEINPQMVTTISIDTAV
ncbi:hypothetical protein [Arthrobacter sp. B1805]|uniref:hypothetical protein n=1 Tax=Arthrobacter sp. B1805 TaxID=2058892 RepID=UPI000CE56F44|nr:hypothetical protein [Arthrobacter sp. B1805]